MRNFSHKVKNLKKRRDKQVKKAKQVAKSFSLYRMEYG